MIMRGIDALILSVGFSELLSPMWYRILLLILFTYPVHTLTSYFLPDCECSCWTLRWLSWMKEKAMDGTTKYVTSTSSYSDHFIFVIYTIFKNINPRQGSTTLGEKVCYMLNCKTTEISRTFHYSHCHMHTSSVTWCSISPRSLLA